MCGAVLEAMTDSQIHFYNPRSRQDLSCLMVRDPQGAETIRTPLHRPVQMEGLGEHRRCFTERTRHRLVVLQLGGSGDVFVRCKDSP